MGGLKANLSERSLTSDGGCGGGLGGGGGGRVSGARETSWYLEYTIRATPTEKYKARIVSSRPF